METYINCMMTDTAVDLTADASNLDAAGDDRILIVHRGVVVGAVHSAAVHGSKTIRMTVTRDAPEQPLRGQQAQTIEWFK